MVPVVIFADRLYSFTYPNEGINEFERIFDRWNDVEYLEEFFERHKKDLQSGFYQPHPSVEDAVLCTYAEAKRFENELRSLAQANANALDKLFKPLSENEDHFPLPRYKAYGQRNKSWLRIYAIKIEHRYYVTGGAIKITKSMNEREHTEVELRKIRQCLSWLKEEGITDIEGATELDL